MNGFSLVYYISTALRSDGSFFRGELPVELRWVCGMLWVAIPGIVRSRRMLL